MWYHVAMVSSLRDIADTIKRHEDTLQQNYKVHRLGVFGSLARGDNTDVSDIDMLVELSRPIGLFKFVELENYLGRILGRKVDLVTKDALKPLIKDEILSETAYV